MTQLSLLTALLLVAFSSLLAAESLATEPAEYQTKPKQYQLDGVIEAVNRSTIAAQTSGQVEQILFDVDDTVEKGALIIQLKSVEQESQLQQAEAEVNRATAVYKEAQGEYRRIKGVFEKSLVSKSSLDKALSALKTSKATQASSLANLEQAREQLQYTAIRAPYSGIVTQRHVELGEFAAAGQPLISGVSLDQLRVTVAVPQSMVETVRAEHRSWVQLSPKNIIEIRDLTVFPIANARSNTFKVRIPLPTGTQSAFPGMFVKVIFAVGSQKQLMIPSQSIVYRSEVTGAYVVGADGKIQFRYIRIGKQSPESTQVLAGLEAGEQLALDPIAAEAMLHNQRTANAHE